MSPGVGTVPGFLCTPPMSGTASPSDTVAAADWAESPTVPSGSYFLSPYLESSHRLSPVLTAPTSSPRVVFPPSPRPSSSSHSSRPPPTATTTSTTSATSMASATTTPRKPIECPLCAVYDITVGFRRKSDFKKHLQNFHPTDSLWVCAQPTCRTVFDVERAYVQHIRTEHSHPSASSASDPVLPSADAARVRLCPQLVFACGFLGCKTVLEARDESDSPVVADRYFDHLASHFDVGSKPSAVAASSQSEWTYYTQMQNLLRQTALKEAWKAASWNKTVRMHLRWQPRSSGDLKKLLETRHLGDVSRLLHAAFTLGSSSFADPEHPPPPSFPGESARPVRGKCPLNPEGGVCAVSSSSSSSSSASAAASSPTSMTTSVGGGRGLGVTPLRIVTSSNAADQGLTGAPSMPFLGQTQPPPRSVPEEPDSVDGHPHPGTPFAVPETETWVDDDEGLFGPRADVMGLGQLHPAVYLGGSSLESGMVSAELWGGGAAVGDKQAQMVPTGDSRDKEGTSPWTPNKRGLSWGRRSWEGSRFMKRRAGHFTESKSES